VNSSDNTNNKLSNQPSNKSSDIIPLNTNVVKLTSIQNRTISSCCSQLNSVNNSSGPILATPLANKVSPDCLHHLEGIPRNKNDGSQTSRYRTYKYHSTQSAACRSRATAHDMKDLPITSRYLPIILRRYMYEENSTVLLC
jgi:hypothetical protein